MNSAIYGTSASTMLTQYRKGVRSTYLVFGRQKRCMENQPWIGKHTTHRSIAVAPFVKILDLEKVQTQLRVKSRCDSCALFKVRICLHQCEKLHPVATRRISIPLDYANYKVPPLKPRLYVRNHAEDHEWIGTIWRYAPFAKCVWNPELNIHLTGLLSDC
mmetsp:Transcript_20175/g.31549  ORF Transcript_20175/g.31549 Transcript_20175/m.31549 type:complete len:160 (-) Transcript_20175:117-596(-)